jgi:hypothetical protein
MISISDSLIDYRYHSVTPQNVKTTYGDFDVLDFIISAPARKLVGGSVKLLFDVKVLNNDDVAVKCSYDGPTGLHSLIESINVSTAQQGQIENIRMYQRMISCTARASMAPEDLFNSAMVAEGRCPDQSVSDRLLKGFVPQDFNTQAYNDEVTTPLDGCLKLACCLNQMIGDNLLPLAKTGDITLSLTLPRTVSALWGNGTIGGDQVYQLSNVKLLFNTVLDDGKYAKNYTMKVKSDFKQSINSTFVALSSSVPIVADSCFLNFIRGDQENNSAYNSLQCQVLPGVSRVSFLFNDSFSEAITYELDNVVDWIATGVKAVKGTTAGDSDTSLIKQSGDDCFLLGLNFGQYIPLATTKFSINIESAVQSGTPYICYAHFNGLLSL